ncbi:MaoC family dehydratase [Ahrensia sp. R2A130]|uniref:MaoC family dehydratase n=1 Tax=Ahrensia sp. R2A130 TaxID=744979 RepID=UPI0001E0F088|nr:MaoC family dehydratase [Ahrensia sp. R2A130]EFL90450.1 MoaC domain protein [Ahrensia sp. R2A130]
MPGLYFDEFSVGQIFEHELRRTITEADNMSFSLMTMNPQPLHIDRHFAKDTEWGEPLVNSLLTLGLVIGLSVQDTTLGTTIGNLGMTDTRFPAPVLQGDTVSARTTVTSLRASKSKPDRGVVEFKHEGFNQRGELVCECVRQAMMLKRPEANT